MIKRRSQINNTNLVDFPELTENELRDLTMGIYQLKKQSLKQRNILMTMCYMKSWPNMMIPYLKNKFGPITHLAKLIMCGYSINKV